MKTKAILTCLAAATGLMCVGSASAQEPDQFFQTQDFNFPANETLINKGDWVERGTATTPELLVVDGALQYGGSGIPASSGNSVFINNETGQSARLMFSPITPGDDNTYYWSAIVEWDGAEVLDGSSYFASFLVSDSPTTTFFRGVLRVGGTGTTLSDDVFLGVQLYSSTNSVTGFAETKPITANEPVFVVVKVTEVAGTRNDTAELFVFTGTDPVPASEPASPDAEHTYSIGGTGSGDIAVSNSGFGITGFSIRQFQSNWPNDWRIDMVRAGSTWQSVITGSTSVDEWMMY